MHLFIYFGWAFYDLIVAFNLSEQFTAVSYQRIVTQQLDNIEYEHFCFTSQHFTHYNLILKDCLLARDAEAFVQAEKPSSSSRCAAVSIVPPPPPPPP